MKTPESFVVRDCLAYLNLRGVFAWRNNSGATKIQTAGAKTRYIRYGLPGSSDIIGIFRGRFLAVECKSDSGRVSDAQGEFLRAVADEGGIAVIARNVADLEAALREATN